MNLLAITTCMAFISMAHAQPSKIVLRINGTTELVEREHDNSTPEDQPRTSVPVFSEQVDGTLLPGVYYKGYQRKWISH